MGAGHVRPPSFLLLPDAGNAGNTGTSGGNALFYYLPKVPLAARNGVGEPVFSLTILLSRRPDADEDTIYPLIQQGTVSFDVTLAVPQAALDTLRTDPQAAQADYKPLFARAVSFSLIEDPQGTGRVLASATASGPDARAGLVATLDRDSTLAVLSALDNQTTGIEVLADVSYRTVASEGTFRLRGSWATIYDEIADRGNPEGVPIAGGLSLGQLRDSFEGMLKRGVISIYEVYSSGAEQRTANVDSAQAFSNFMQLSSVILTRETPELEIVDRGNRYSLRGRPGEMFNLDARWTTSGGTTSGDTTGSVSSVTLSAPLETVLGGTLDGLDRDAYIHLVSPSPQGGGSNGGGGIISPRRITTPRTAPSKRGPGSPGAAAPQARMAALNGNIKSLALALRPNPTETSPAKALLHSDIVVEATSLGQGQRQRNWWLDDGTLDDDQPIIQHLPVVTDPAAPIWADRATPSSYWYPLSFELVQPQPNGDPGSSPFLFTFERSGATASAKLGLNGTIRFTLHTKKSDQTTTALAAINNPQAQPVPALNMSVWLELPFRDETGTTRTQSFTASLEQAGDTITATVKLIDDWVRLCYGALAQQGFQSQPARVYAAYSYSAYVPAGPKDVELAFGGKVAVTPVVYSEAEVRAAGSRPIFDAREATYRLPTAEMKLRREAPLPKSNGSGSATENRGALLGSTMVATVTKPAPTAVATSTLSTVATVATRPTVALAIARPELSTSVNIAALVGRRRYMTRTLLHQEQMDALFPCASLGVFYREIVNGEEQAVGCRDALQLGQTTYRQYEEMLDQADPDYYSIYRSLQQPGRFLIVPRNYRITRYSPSDPQRAYRPAILVFSSIDAGAPANNRVLFSATLQPDIPPFVRRELQAKLAAYAQQPHMDYPTGIESEITFAWTVGGGINVTPGVVTTPDGFQVTLTTDLAGALFVRNMLQTSGVVGSATFKLPDGSTLRSNLAMDLTAITGPFDAGPIEVVAAEGGALLTNKIESDVEVQDLLLYSGAVADDGQHTPVETVLAQGASYTTAFPAGAPPTETYPVYKVHASQGTLEEIRSFVEDIATNVIFVDLINEANHGLKRLDVQARIKVPGNDQGRVPGNDQGGSIDHIYQVPMSGDPPVGDVDIILPLTTYLDNVTLQFQVTKTSDADVVTTTPWIDWNLKEMGNVVSLVWPMIQ